MNQIQYWIIYILMFAGFVMLFKIYRMLIRLHTEHVTARLDRDRDRRRSQARELSEIMLRMGPRTLPDDILQSMFGHVPDVFRGDGNSNTDPDSK